jgi:hypothetical protein
VSNLFPLPPWIRPAHRSRPTLRFLPIHRFDSAGPLPRDPRDTDCRWPHRSIVWTDVDHVRDEGGVDVRSCRCLGKKVIQVPMPALCRGLLLRLRAQCPTSHAPGTTLVQIVTRPDARAAAT